MKKAIVVIIFGLFIFGLLKYSQSHPIMIIGTTDGGVKIRSCFGTEIHVHQGETGTIYCLGIPTSL